jgi:hypothetical protein
MGDKPPLLLDRIREAVHHDLEQPAFCQKLISAACEYETRISGPIFGSDL